MKDLLVPSILLLLYRWVPVEGFHHPNPLSYQTALFTSVERREFLESIGIASVSLYAPTAVLAADDGTTDETTGFDLKCLLDLPPKPSDCIRIYLCRHGQTENNRLRIVQGRRVDAPLNSNGIEMAKRLGKTLANLEEPPSIMVHSPLLRAKQTAEIAAEQLTAKPKFEVLETISEVDFGPAVDGQPVSEARSGMVKTYGAWSIGLIDTYPEGGGESGREVLQRSSSALRSLISLTNESQVGCIAAVAHSTYLKILLAVLMEEPLAKASSRTLANASINVLDMKRDGSTTSIQGGSNLFGGTPLSRAPSNFKLKVPSGNVVRFNEDRHLRGISLS
mmetsp:Transcript_34147/g.48526  ORF Transcript_34147/g.48526 Transcript_34147/m.48526 type:complete len:335 (+) Transcript_34147:943-1947(+)